MRLYPMKCQLLSGHLHRALLFLADTPAARTITQQDRSLFLLILQAKTRKWGYERPVVSPRE